jgi:hypothetical protein
LTSVTLPGSSAPAARMVVAHARISGLDGAGKPPGPPYT